MGVAHRVVVVAWVAVLGACGAGAHEGRLGSVGGPDAPDLAGGDSGADVVGETSTSGEDSGTSQDTRTSIEDTSTSIEDTSTSTEDSGASTEDTNTSLEDTGLDDTRLEDTNVEDTNVGDTNVGDTNVDDTSLEDAGPSVDDTSLEDTSVEEVADAHDSAELSPADEDALHAWPYLMWVTRTAVSVRWETKTPVVGRVDFGASEALGRTIEEASARTTHELRLTGLEPDTEYHYRVVYDDGALPTRRFRTAPPDDSDAPFRFIVWGDNQDGPATFDDLVSIMYELEPRFAVSVGDCVQNGTRGEYRSQLFSPMAGFADEVPFLVAAGNHERYSDPDANLFSEYFSQPGDEHCFGWRYGGLFVLFIDTDLPLDGENGQRECIETALSSEAARTARIQAAAFHKPPRVEWWFGGLLAFPDSMEAPWVREELEPLLESYGVDVVFNGHNHLYAHTPETPGGITWITTGGGGGRIDNRGLFDVWRVGTWPQIETTLHVHHFIVATMEGDELLLEAIDLDGEIIHRVWVWGD